MNRAIMTVDELQRATLVCTAELNAKRRILNDEQWDAYCRRLMQPLKPCRDIHYWDIG